VAIDIKTAWDGFVALGAIFVVVTGAQAVAPALAARYRRTTFGRRHDHYRRLQRLGTNAQLAFFNDALGQTPAYRRTFSAEVTTLAGQEGEMTANSAYLTRIALFMHEMDAPADDEPLSEEAVTAPNARREMFEFVRSSMLVAEVVWVDRDYYVQSLIDHDETVLAYAVTSRSPPFSPKILRPFAAATHRALPLRAPPRTSRSAAFAGSQRPPPALAARHAR
jgi:hypothetical protein